MTTALAGPRLLVFAFLATLFSAFGQTFFVGLFSGAWRESFGLSHVGLGSLYSGATLASGLVIVKVGRWIDHMPLARFTTGTLLGFAAGCAAIAWAPGPAMLTLGIFLIRQCGQGLMGHLAITTIARAFLRARGRALAVAQLGFPAGEALFPWLIVLAGDAYGWRWAWGLAAVSLLLLVLPMRRLSLAAPAPDTSPQAASSGTHATRRDVLRDRRFYALLPVVLTTPFLITGLFFHQAAVIEAKSWKLATLASAFVAFAITQVCGGLIAGWAIDRVGARRLMRFYLLPFGAGCAVLAASTDGSAAFLYLALLGFSAGAGSSLSGALWAELYGTQHLGAIRAMLHALMVVSTAASPVLFGLALDAGVAMETIAWACAAYVTAVGPCFGGAAARPAIDTECEGAGKKQG